MKSRAFLLLLLAVSYAGAAHAYVDPGTGMMLLQGLVAAVGAALVVIGRPWRWLKEKLKSRRRPDAGS